MSIRDVRLTASAYSWRREVTVSIQSHWGMLSRAVCETVTCNTEMEIDRETLRKILGKIEMTGGKARRRTLPARNGGETRDDA